MGIYDKTCPRCMTSNIASTLRCTCGYSFDIPDDDEDLSATAEQLAIEERLFAEYLEARAEQALEAATVAARAAESEPDNERRASEAMRAKRAAEKLAAEVTAQRIKAAQAAHAAGIPVTRPDPPTLRAQPTHNPGPPPNGRPGLSMAVSAPVVTKPPVQRTISKPTPRQTGTSRAPHTRPPAPTVAATVGRLPAAPRPAVAAVSIAMPPRTPVARPATQTRPRAVVARPNGTAVRRPPALSSPGWQAVVTKSVGRVARHAAGAAARGANKAAKGVAKAAARGATKVARHAARAAVQTAQKAVEAAQHRRRAKQARARVIPVLVPRPPITSSPPVSIKAPPRTAVPVVARPERPVRHHVAQSVKAAPVAPAIRQAPAKAAPANTAEPRPRTQPSAAFRQAQAVKIEQVVTAARALDDTNAAVECALCSASLSADAERCLCGWRVPNHMRDIPALEPAASGPNGHGNELTVVFRSIECPVCTAELAPNAVGCSCGWKIPEGTNELPPVSLSAEEISSLSFDAVFGHPAKPR